LENHLRDAISIMDQKRIYTEIDQKDFDLATVVGIDCTRGIENGYPELVCQSAPWPNLGLVA
jgi:septum formation inhibitor-activating ATPase MinD